MKTIFLSFCTSLMLLSQLTFARDLIDFKGPIPKEAKQEIKYLLDIVRHQVNEQTNVSIKHIEFYSFDVPYQLTKLRAKEKELRQLIDTLGNEKSISEECSKVLEDVAPIDENFIWNPAWIVFWKLEVHLKKLRYVTIIGIFFIKYKIIDTVFKYIQCQVAHITLIQNLHSLKIIISGIWKTN